MPDRIARLEREAHLVMVSVRARVRVGVRVRVRVKVSPTASRGWSERVTCAPPCVQRLP